jgi:hypothetical protein
VWLSWGDEPLHILAKLSKDHGFGGGRVNIQQGKELLKLILSDPMTCQKAEGELFGLTVNLKSEAGVFKGTLLLKDGAKLAELTGNESFKDVSGLLLSGHLPKRLLKERSKARCPCERVSCSRAPRQCRLHADPFSHQKPYSSRSCRIACRQRMQRI